MRGRNTERRRREIYNQLHSWYDQLTANSDEDGEGSLLDHVEDKLAKNSFCPTGEGGGVDPSCSGSSKSSSKQDIADRKSLEEAQSSVDYHNKMHGRQIASLERPKYEMFHDSHRLKVEDQVSKLIDNGGKSKVVKQFFDGKGSSNTTFYVNGKVKAVVSHSQDQLDKEDGNALHVGISGSLSKGLVSEKDSLETITKKLRKELRFKEKTVDNELTVNEDDGGGPTLSDLLGVS